MNYLMFHNGAFTGDGGEDPGSIEKARLCCVDVDVMIASAPQDHVDKKDSILAGKFEEAYSNEYITLHEKIDSNIFQVIGIRAQKVREVYALVPSAKVEVFAPYAVAIRGLLTKEGIGRKKAVVFADDLGDEKLVTVFEGLKFSRTRSVNAQKAQDILPDIKRSYIDFNKKLGEFADKSLTGDFMVVTNNRQLAEDIKSLDADLDVEFLDHRYPALEGLKFTDTPIKYRLHEEIILERKKKELHSRLVGMAVSMGICLAVVLFFGLNRITYSHITRDFQREGTRNSQLKEALFQLDRRVYRDVLKKSKWLDYPGIFFEVSGLLPGTYTMTTFKFAPQGDVWMFDAYIFARDDQFYDEIPRTRILGRASIKDFFINGRPGKYLKVVL